MASSKNNSEELGWIQTFIKNYKELDYWSQKQVLGALVLIATFCPPVLYIIFILIKNFLITAYVSNLGY